MISIRQKLIWLSLTERIHLQLRVLRIINQLSIHTSINLAYTIESFV